MPLSFCFLFRPSSSSSSSSSCSSGYSNVLFLLRGFFQLLLPVYFSLFFSFRGGEKGDSTSSNNCTWRAQSSTPTRFITYLSKTNEMVLTSDSSRNSRRRPANSWPAAEPFNLFHYTQPGPYTWRCFCLFFQFTDTRGCSRCSGSFMNK